MFQDIHTDADDNNMESATELAYFEGDHWPKELEKYIKKLKKKPKRTRKRKWDEAEAAATKAEETPDESIYSQDVPVGVSVGRILFANAILCKVHMFICMCTDIFYSQFAKDYVSDP